MMTRPVMEVMEVMAVMTRPVMTVMAVTSVMAFASLSTL